MKRSVISITLTLAILAFVLPGCGPYADEGPDRDSLGGFHKAVLTDAPEVPPPTDYSTTQKVIVSLEIVEKIMRLADGVEYRFWTFDEIGRASGREKVCQYV